MFKAHDYALNIETTVNAIFKSERFGMGGIADANFIVKDPFIAIALVLGNYYNRSGDVFKERIEDFIGKYYLQMGKSIEEIGEEKIKNIVEDFNRIVATV